MCTQHNVIFEQQTTTCGKISQCCIEVTREKRGGGYPDSVQRRQSLSFACTTRKKSVNRGAEDTANGDGAGVERHTRKHPPGFRRKRRDSQAQPDATFRTTTPRIKKLDEKFSLLCGLIFSPRCTNRGSYAPCFPERLLSFPAAGFEDPWAIPSASCMVQTARSWQKTCCFELGRAIMGEREGSFSDFRTSR